MTYHYFLLGDTMPVRVTLNDKAFKLAAEVPDRNKGCLVQDVKYIGRIEESFEVEEITEDEFDKLCTQIYTQRIDPKHLPNLE